MADTYDPNKNGPRVETHDSMMDEEPAPGERNYEVHRKVRDEHRQTMPAQRSPLDGLLSTFVGRTITFLIVAIVFGAIVWGLSQLFV